ncbi:uncharacterized protein K460DRAFT_370292 [Cucurbitaria berberidis CBS 394.84]|uniref:Uncharacterized protein n=1 Tax=Cucurbitaria berberidis CBS 394.84 TaxID=1168544 RepID=A0A9P4L5S7_9PLEO|nr:uncharacterized protein K460DRAFT_370292 [Cucurbitaria berberidis CBS 394.84]KAF1842318.1 hypothetical protein K460DRAFT_370292 [Cucurbitaria berberidis CBS 394.84]
MPIVGSPRTGNTSTLGCSTYLMSLSDVGATTTRIFTDTFPEIPSRPSSLNAPPLTTIYTPPPQCLDRWMLEPPRTIGCGNTEIPPFTVFSVDPSKSIVSDPSYKDCQLYKTPTYSPGICPHGQTIAGVTAFQSNVSTGIHTFWQASCCRRFVNRLCTSLVIILVLIACCQRYDI